MAAISPYNDLIMDHIRNARNYREIDDANRYAEESNPLCGDSIAVYVKTGDTHVEDIGFQCECCGIAMASASIMTESVIGRSVIDARVILGALVASLHGDAALTGHAFEPAQIAVVQAVRDAQSRVRCAALPWAALQAALAEPDQTVDSLF